MGLSTDQFHHASPALSHQLPDSHADGGMTYSLDDIPTDPHHGFGMLPPPFSPAVLPMDPGASFLSHSDQLEPILGPTPDMIAPEHKHVYFHMSHVSISPLAATA